MKTPDLERAYLQSSDLHVTQTLDRFYFTDLDSTRERDYDQVVYRYTSKRHNDWKDKNPSDTQLHDREQLHNYDVRTDGASLPTHLIHQTLDQYYYSSISGTRDGDYDQIVYRHTTKQRTVRHNKHPSDTQPHHRELRTDQHETSAVSTESETQDIENNVSSSILTDAVTQGIDNLVPPSDEPPISLLMVQHLWMWKIDERKHHKLFYIPDINNYRDNNYGLS